MYELVFNLVSEAVFSSEFGMAFSLGRELVFGLDLVFALVFFRRVQVIV